MNFEIRKKVFRLALASIFVFSNVSVIAAPGDIDVKAWKEEYGKQDSPEGKVKVVREALNSFWGKNVRPSEREALLKGIEQKKLVEFINFLVEVSRDFEKWKGTALIASGINVELTDIGRLILALDAEGKKVFAGFSAPGVPPILEGYTNLHLLGSAAVGALIIAASYYVWKNYLAKKQDDKEEEHEEEPVAPAAESSPEAQA